MTKIRKMRVSSKTARPHNKTKGGVDVIDKNVQLAAVEPDVGLSQFFSKSCLVPNIPRAQFLQNLGRSLVGVNPTRNVEHTITIDYQES